LTEVLLASPQDTV